MTSQQIHCFCTVARNMSFTAAAQELFVSQPAVSRQISMLEKELEIALFDRRGGKTRLTEAGEIMYEYFRNSKEAFFQELQRAHDIAGNKTPQLTLGVLDGWTISEYIRPLQERLAANHFCCEIEIHNFGSMMSALRAHTLDAAILIDVSEERNPDLKMINFAYPREVILFSKKHPLVGKVDLSPVDFKEELFIVPPHLSDKKVSTKDFVKRLFEPYHFVPRIRLVSNWATMMEYVRNGIGVCVNIRWAGECMNEDFSFIEMKSSHPIQLVWSRENESDGLSVLIQELIQLFREEKK